MAAFYEGHRIHIVGMFIAALLGLIAWRLGVVDSLVRGSCVLRRVKESSSGVHASDRQDTVDAAFTHGL